MDSLCEYKSSFLLGHLKYHMYLYYQIMQTISLLIFRSRMEIGVKHNLGLPGIDMGGIEFKSSNDGPMLVLDWVGNIFDWVRS